MQRYKFAIAFYGEDSRPLGQVPVEVDWEPAREQVRLKALRGGRNCPAVLSPAPVEIEPLWSSHGEPYLEAFRATLTTDGESFTHEFSGRYFRLLAEQTSSQLVERGVLKKGEDFRFWVCAFRRARGADPPSPGKTGFTVQEVGQSLRIGLSSIKPLLAASTTLGSTDDRDLPVFIPQAILEEAAEVTRQAGPVEAGGILIGEIQRDTDQFETLFLTVTAQIPAAHTVAASTKLTFTAETWNAVDAAIKLRRRDEVMLGWWHSHPARFWCRDCPPDKRNNCPLRLGRPFFSADDVSIQRTIFPTAYSFALLATHTEAGIQFTGFGWCDGVVESRGLYISDAAPTVEATDGREEDNHVAANSA